MDKKSSSNPIVKFERFKKLLWILPVGILISFWKLDIQGGIMFTGILFVVAIIDYRRFKKSADQYRQEHSSQDTQEK